MLRLIMDSLVLLAALWLMVSPYAYGFYDISTPAGVASFFGLGVFILATIELSLPEYWKEVAICFLGVIISTSPWLFGDINYMSHKATISIDISGTIIVVCSILGILASIYTDKVNKRLAKNS